MCIQVMVPHVSVSEFTVVMKVWGDNSETRDTDMIGLHRQKCPYMYIGTGTNVHTAHIHVYMYVYLQVHYTLHCVFYKTKNTNMQKG